jgi:hypothetical protein
MAEINLNPYTAESDAIARRLRMAEALNQQAMQPMELPTQAGVRVSPYAGLAKMLQGYTSGLMQNQALGQQEALSKRYAADTGADFQSLMKALTAPGQAAVPAGAPTYTPNVGAGELADNARMTMQPERNEMGEIIQPGQPGAGNFGITPGAPAQAARLAGQLTPEGFGSMRTPMGQQQYMAQFLTQNVPKEAKWEVKEIKTEGGGTKTVLMNMNSRDPLGTAVEAGKQGPKASYVDIGGTQVPVTGFEPTPQPLVKTLTPGDKQARELSDRAFTQLSANQRAGLENDAARLGISAQQLYFDTGLSAGGGARLPANVPVIPGAPTIASGSTQPASTNTRLSAALAAPTAPTAPAAGPASVNAPVSLSPRARQDLEKARQLEEFKGMTETQSNAALFGGAMNQAQNVITQLEKQGTVKNAVVPSVLQSIVKLVPFGVGEQTANIIESVARTDPTSLFGPDQNQQKLGQAQIAFATAWLRKTSGAAFGGSEIANTIKEYFPLIGEGEGVIKQKAEARNRAIEGLRLSTGAQGKSYIDKYGGAMSANDPLGLGRR